MDSVNEPSGCGIDGNTCVRVGRGGWPVVGGLSNPSTLPPPVRSS